MPWEKGFPSVEGSTALTRVLSAPLPSRGTNRKCSRKHFGPCTNGDNRPLLCPHSPSGDPETYTGAAPAARGKQDDEAQAVSSRSAWPTAADGTSLRRLFEGGLYTTGPEAHVHRNNDRQRGRGPAGPGLTAAYGGPTLDRQAQERFSTEARGGAPASRGGPEELPGEPAARRGAERSGAERAGRGEAELKRRPGGRAACQQSRWPPGGPGRGRSERPRESGAASRAARAARGFWSREAAGRRAVRWGAREFGGARRTVVAARAAPPRAQRPRRAAMPAQNTASSGGGSSGRRAGGRG